MGLPMALLVASLLLAGQVASAAALNSAMMPVQELTNSTITMPVKETVQDSFHVDDSTGKAYLAFLADLDYHVGATAASLVKHHPVLAQQQLRAAPPTWFNITLTGKGKDRVDFFFRSDNLYMSGFANSQAKLFAFQPQGNQYTMPGATLLSFGGGYPDLFGKKDGARGLRRVQVNHAEALKHLKALSNHQGGPDKQLMAPLGFFILVIAEAERFPPIRAAVFDRWDSGVRRVIDDLLKPKVYVLDLVTSWRLCSCALLSWNAHGQTSAAWNKNREAKEIGGSLGVASAEDALSKVNPILQPSDTKCSWT